MSRLYYFQRYPCGVHLLGTDQKRPIGPVFKTFRKARKALIEELQADARYFKHQADLLLQDVLKASRLEEPVEHEQ